MWLVLFARHALGDRLSSTGLRNAFVNACVSLLVEVDKGRHHGKHSPARPDIPLHLPIRYVYEMTHLRDGLRKLLVDFAINTASEIFSKSNFCAAQHPDFVVDLGVKLAGCRLIGSGRYTIRAQAPSRKPGDERCISYHDHPKAERIGLASLED